MGYQLYRHCLDHAPADLDPTARLVLLAIADDANEQTRVSSYLGMDLLCHRIGRGPETVKKALQRLAKLGYELRQPIGTDKSGRPVYAKTEHHSVYRVPVFPERDVPKKGGTPSPLRGEQVPARGEHVPSVGGTSSPPIPQDSPQDAPQSVPARETEDPAAAAAEELQAQTGRTVTHEWGQRVAQDLLAAASGPVRNEAGYVRKAIRARAEAKRAHDLLPTPGPRRLEDIDDPPPMPAPGPPAETAPCGHGWPADDAENCFVCAKERRAAETAPAADDTAPEPPDDARPDLTVHHGHARPSSRHSPGQAPLLTTVPATEEPAEPAAPRTPAEWAALARAGLKTGTDNTTQ